MMSEDALRSFLNNIPSPFSPTNEGLVNAGCLESLSIESSRIVCVLSVPPPQDPETKNVLETLMRQVYAVLREKVPSHEILVIPTSALTPQIPQKPWGVRQVKHIIVVASGKGGVGKSTVSVNLALALQNLGHTVGILDADIYGPSLSRLLDVHEKPVALGEKKFKPVIKHNLTLMSMSFLLDMEAPLIWRGPMIQGVITQLLTDVDWGELDILVVDLPPGTGDVPLTLMQKVSLSGAVIVSTPQDISLIDARKAIEMFQKLGVPILGIIENMSVFVCPHCQHETPIFSQGGVQKEAEKKNIFFLGEIKLDTDICKASDQGVPLDLKSPLGAPFLRIGEKVKMQLT